MLKIYYNVDENMPLQRRKCVTVSTLLKIGTLLILINKHAHLHVQVTVSTPLLLASYTKILQRVRLPEPFLVGTRCP